MTTVTYLDCQGKGGKTTVGKAIKDPSSHEFAARAKERVDHSLEFWESAFSRRDIPDFRCCVNWGGNNANAIWYRRKVMLGDGDDCHRSYTDSQSIIMHEITHSLAEPRLANTSESNAIKEHICDVFGILALQWRQIQTGEEPDWLFGSEVRLCTPESIRNMRVPNENARDEGAMTWSEATARPDDYYFNAGVLNRAFALASDSIALPPWQSTGPVWHRTLDQLEYHMDSPRFVNLVIANAGEFEREIVDAFRMVEFDV